MRKRAELVDETRQRITEAAVRLHTTVGPAATTVSALAEQAGVTRLTVYRHFPDDEALFASCIAHWAERHPFPDLGRWMTVADLRERAAKVLGDLYGWYRRHGEELFPIYRDVSAVPEAGLRQMAAQQEQLVDTVVGDWPARGRARRHLRAAAGHAVSLWTWRSLALEQELSDREAVELVLAMLDSAAGTT